MRDQAVLRRFVVVRRDDKQAVGPGPLGLPRQFARMRRVVGADAGDDGGTAADGLDHRPQQPILLAV